MLFPSKLLATINYILIRSWFTADWFCFAVFFFFVFIALSCPVWFFCRWGCLIWRHIINLRIAYRGVSGPENWVTRVGRTFKSVSVSTEVCGSLGTHSVSHTVLYEAFLWSLPLVLTCLLFTSVLAFCDAALFARICVAGGGFTSVLTRFTWPLGFR